MRIVRKSEVMCGRGRSRSALFNSMAMGRERAVDILLEAREAWDSLDEFRQGVIRNRKYTYGDQWSDRVKDPKRRSLRM